MKTRNTGRLGWIIAVYLLGIFMGAIDTGIVSPARTIIQGALGADEKTGIWMITIYTLAYAAVIPISGKLADRLGRKYVYVISVALFGTGSLICGLSNFAGSFPLLLAGRVVQALGGGGIVPIATAEFGTGFPEEKRGMALGLVGGVYGIANILGSTIGSAILNAFGNNNWQMLFFVNLPICVFIVIAGLITLPNTKMETVKKIDIFGTLLLVAMILSLLYGLRNIDFFHFSATIKSTDVYPFLIAFAVLLPVFLLAERKAEDPVLDLGYFTCRNTLTSLILSFLSGVCLMGLIFVPQFSENALKIATGSGGYFVAILGAFAGVVAPLGGVLIDKFGPKKVLFLGFIVILAGALFLSLVATNQGGWLTVVTSLAIIGLGIGLTIGPPLNYMMLANTPKDESNSSLAALSLVRSIGTAIAPAVMIGFLAQAGITTQANLMGLLPPPQAPTIALADKVSADFAGLKADPDFSDMLKNAQLPDFNASKSMDISMTGGTLPKDLRDSLQSADVTNIVSRVKSLAEYMFRQNTPAVVQKIQAGIQTGLDNFKTGLAQLDKAENGVKDGIAGLQSGIDGMNAGVSGAQKGVDQMNQGIARLDVAIANAPSPAAKAPLQAQRQQMQTALEAAQAKLAGLRASLADNQGKLIGMQKAAEKMDADRAKLLAFQTELQQLKDSIPDAFAESLVGYEANIDAMSPKIVSAFQSGLNGGFKGMFNTVAAAAILAAFVLAFYQSKRKHVVSLPTT